MGIFTFHFLFYIYSIYLSNSRKECKENAVKPVFMQTFSPSVLKNHARNTYILEEGEQNYSVKTLPAAAY